MGSKKIALAIVALLGTFLLLSGTAGAQYITGQTTTTTTTTVPGEVEGETGEVEPEEGEVDEVDEVDEVAAPSDSGPFLGELPFTGTDVVQIVVVAMALIVIGLALARRRRSAVER